MVSPGCFHPEITVLASIARKYLGGYLESVVRKRFMSLRSLSKSLVKVRGHRFKSLVYES